MFHVLEGEIEVTFRGARSNARAGETVNVPANAPHPFATPRSAPPDCCAWSLPQASSGTSASSATARERGFAEHLDLTSDH